MQSEKRVSPVIEQAPDDGGLQSEKRVSPHIKSTEKHSGTQKENIQQPHLPPTTHQRRALPFPRRRYPAGTIWESYEEREYSFTSDDDDGDSQDEWEDHSVYYDAPEFTGFDAERYKIPESYGTTSKDIQQQLSNNIRFPGFQSAKHMIQYKDYNNNADNISRVSMHSAPPLPVSFSNLVPSDTEDEDDFMQTGSRSVKKKGPQVDDRFPLPSLGDLQHPYIEWIIDRVTMDEYMPNYAKQEGFALTRTKDGIRVRWRCVHAERYRNRNNLPAEVTEKERRKELLDAGIRYYDCAN